MSTADTPSFDNFFQEQKAGRQQSTDSFDGTQTYPGAYDHNVQLGQVVTEEPMSLSRRDSVGSSSNASRPPGSAQGQSHRIGSLRQDSTRRKETFPWQSTMISTAGQPRENIGNIMFAGPAPAGNSQHYQHPSWDGSQQYNPGNQHYPQDSSAYLQHPSQPAGEYLPNQAASPYQSGYNQTNNGWAYGQENGGAGVSYDWSGEAPAQMEGMLGEDLQELERIISNSQAGSVQPSREGTPFQPDLSAQQDIKPDISNFQSLEAAVGSRSPSPYQPLANVISPAPSGTLSRNSPSPHGSSPFANKPQSPPALIIPNSTSHSSPATQNLPPIITSTGNQGGAGASKPQQGAGLGGAAGGLFPPANPALTGMAGISPIAPNADGPMIYIQPSTPISGLKDGRGVFDFKRVVQGQHAQAQPAQQQQVEGFVPPPATHALSRHTSVEGLNQTAQSPRPQQPDLANQQATQAWDPSWGELRPNTSFRPRAKSDSHADGGAGTYNKQAYGDNGVAVPFALPADMTEEELRATVDQWRTNTAGQGQAPLPTLDPRQLPGQDSLDSLTQFNISQQLSQLRAQRDRLPPLNVGAAKQESGGQMSPTSMAFYAQLGVNPGSASQLGTASAPFYQSTFEQVPEGQWPQTAGPTQSFLAPDQSGLGPRRRSFAEGSHPAAGAGTPGYGVEFANASPFGTLHPGRLRGVSPGHRRTAKSEDYGRSASGWGVGAGGSTADFLSSITANDGSLVPPARGRSHSRHSSVSSGRSASPALSISSQGSSFSHHSPRMDMPEGVQVPQLYEENTGRKKVAKMKVTSMATEVASSSRRTNDGVFKCPVPGCGSTFTRHFNLKGHLRSHNDERPYKCLYDGCPKATVGFARQHDCKRHMLLHEGLRPFECEGCGKKFARLDALTRHHKSEQGQECAISHPLPTNPDGSAMSESQYKAYRARQHNAAQRGGAGAAGSGMKRDPSYQDYLSGGDRSGEDDFGTGSGMEEYDRV